MPIFDEDMRGQLQNIFQQMDREVNLAYFTQEFECHICSETRSFLKEISSFSDKINLEVFDFLKDKEKAEQLGINKIPGISVLDNRKKDKGIRFFGLPGGYEINSFVKSILEVSGNLEDMPDDIRKRVKEVSKDVHIQVLVTLVCPYCPTAVMNAHRLALENENIKADMVDVSVFNHLANKYDVTGVPKIVINEKHQLTGAQPLDEMLRVIEEME